MSYTVLSRDYFFNSYLSNKTFLVVSFFLYWDLQMIKYGVLSLCEAVVGKKLVLLYDAFLKGLFTMLSGKTPIILTINTE